jgi:hypothetical protein
MTEQLYITVDGKRIEVPHTQSKRWFRSWLHPSGTLEVVVHCSGQVYTARVEAETDAHECIHTTRSDDPQAALDAAFAAMEPWLSDGLREAISK